MNKVIVIPIIVYIVSLLLSLFFVPFLAYSPMVFIFVLFIWWILFRRKIDIYTPEGRDINLIVVYSCSAAIIAPIFAGILTTLIQ